MRILLDLWTIPFFAPPRNEKRRLPWRRGFASKKESIAWIRNLSSSSVLTATWGMAGRSCLVAQRDFVATGDDGSVVRLWGVQRRRRAAALQRTLVLFSLAGLGSTGGAPFAAELHTAGTIYFVFTNCRQIGSKCCLDFQSSNRVILLGHNGPEVAPATSGLNFSPGIFG